jgi:hypothetical protein
MLATVAMNKSAGLRQRIGASAGFTSGSETVSKGSGEPIELEGKVGIEDSQVGLEKEASAGAGFVSMDLDRRLLKAERRQVCAQRLGIGRMRPHHDLPRLSHGGQRLPGHRRDLARVELENLPDQALGDGPGQLDRAIQVSFIARAFRGAQLDPGRRELGLRLLSPFRARVVPHFPRRALGVVEDRTRALLGARQSIRSLARGFGDGTLHDPTARSAGQRHDLGRLRRRATHDPTFGEGHRSAP